MIESLDVILWDKKVGTLVANREGHRSKACFYFDSDYVRNGYDIAPLRAPVKGITGRATEKWTCSSGIIARNWSVLSAFYAKNTGRTDLKALWYVRGHRPKV